MRAAVLSWLLAFSLFACEASFESCAKKVQDLAQVANDKITLPISKNQTLVYSTKELFGAKKSDPFLHLYLFETNTTVKYPFKLNKNLRSKELASINDKIACGKITQKQHSLERFGKFSASLHSPSVVLNGCCFIEAIGTPKGVITKRFLEHFFRYGGVYGDLGIRVKRCKHHLVVEYVNPFLHAPFKVGDRILSIDGKKIFAVEPFQEAVLFMQPGKKCMVEILRCKKKQTLHAVVHKRTGGGYRSDTFLESIGVFVDNKLSVVASKHPDFKKGDKIFTIDSQKVQTASDIKYVLSHLLHNPFLIGINRNGLDLFIKIQTNF